MGRAFNTSAGPACVCRVPRPLLGSEGREIREDVVPSFKGLRLQLTRKQPASPGSLATTSSAMKSKCDPMTQHGQGSDTHQDAVFTPKRGFSRSPNNLDVPQMKETRKYWKEIIWSLSGNDLTQISREDSID